MSAKKGPSVSEEEFFVSAETKQLKLDEFGYPGQWIEVKERLTYGEEKFLASSSMTGMTTGLNSQINLDWKRHAIMRIVTWVTEWSLTQGGKRVKVSIDTVEALNPRVADAIDKCLDAYVEELEEGKPEEIIEIALAKK
jgi:hypothetical protein